MAYTPVLYATDDDKLNIARGLTKYSQVVNIFGYNANVSTEFIPLWESNTAYPFPTSNVGMEIKSSDATDTDVTIKIIGLDSNYESLVEIVNLNGTTEVDLTKEFFRINTMITTAGNANGVVTLCGNTGSPVYGKIRRGDGKNQTSFYTVPAGYNFYLYRIDAFSETANANKYLTFRTFSKLDSGVNLRVAETTFTNQMNIQRRLPFKYSGNTDIVFEAKSSNQTNEVGIFAEGILIEEGQHFE